MKSRFDAEFLLRPLELMPVAADVITYDLADVQFSNIRIVWMKQYGVYVSLHLFPLYTTGNLENDDNLLKKLALNSKIINQ